MATRLPISHAQAHYRVFHSRANTQTHILIESESAHVHTHDGDPASPLTPEQRLAAEQQAQYERITRNLAIGGLVLCPLIAILPPRKLDLYTFSLGVGFYLSADHLCTLRTGRGLVSNLNPMRAVDSMPTERAREMQRVLREEREKSRRATERTEGEGHGKGALGMLEKLWMGDEKEGWKERRLEEEKKALEEGKSYTDMILEQIWDVWNWDKKKSGDGEGEGKKKE